MQIPQASTAAWMRSAIKPRRVASIFRRQRRMQIRWQGHGQALAPLVKGSGQLHVERETDISVVIVHDRTRRGAGQFHQIDEMESIEFLQPYIRDEQIVGRRSQPTAGAFKATVGIDDRERSDGGDEGATGRRIRLDEQDTFVRCGAR